MPRALPSFLALSFLALTLALAGCSLSQPELGRVYSCQADVDCPSGTRCEGGSCMHQASGPDGRTPRSPPATPESRVGRYDFQR